MMSQIEKKFNKANDYFTFCIMIYFYKKRIPELITIVDQSQIRGPLLIQEKPQRLPNCLPKSKIIEQILWFARST